MCVHVTPGSLALMALSTLRMGLDAWERGVCNRAGGGRVCAWGKEGVGRCDTTHQEGACWGQSGEEADSQGLLKAAGKGSSHRSLLGPTEWSAPSDRH